MLLAGSLRAGLTLQMNVIHDCYGSNYTLAPNLYLNGNGGDSTPITFDQVTSPQMNFLGGTGTGATNNRANFPTLGSLMQSATNGIWHLVINVGDPSQTCLYLYRQFHSGPGTLLQCGGGLSTRRRQ